MCGGSPLSGIALPTDILLALAVMAVALDTAVWVKGTGRSRYRKSPLEGGKSWHLDSAVLTGPPTNNQVQAP
jgi:hypothetical protein